MVFSKRIYSKVKAFYSGGKESGSLEGLSWAGKWRGFLLGRGSGIRGGSTAIRDMAVGPAGMRLGRSMWAGGGRAGGMAGGGSMSRMDRFLSGNGIKGKRKGMGIWSVVE